LKRNKELSGVGFALEVSKAGEHPEENMLERFLLTMDNITTEIRVEIGGVAKHLEEATDALLGFVLGFLLEIDRLVTLVKMSKDAVDQFE
jgi:hypothetical protein